MPDSAETPGDRRASLAKRRADVAEMFDAVADRYDLTNDVASLGQDRLWRRRVTQAVEPRRGHRILDLAAGTGTSSLPLRETGAFVVPTDLSLGMLTVGHRQHPELPFVAADALHLPYADASFDAVTISFGLRNVENFPAALRELRRVTKPGGRLVICEFSTPTWAPFRSVYRNYLLAALPRMARTLSPSPSAYVYLAESILAWPDQADLAEQVSAAGWSGVQWRNLSGGIVALHRGTAG